MLPTTLNIKETNMKTLECSSAGDRRFSAMYARVHAFNTLDTIEGHYQKCKRTSDGKIPGKGRKVAYISLNGTHYPPHFLTPFYKLLWCKYLDQHPELVKYLKQFDNFTDKFRGRAINCQADVIRQYVQQGRASILQDCKVLIDALKEK